MTIKYVGIFKADIRLDGEMTFHGMNYHYHSLQEYIDKATELMDVYGFVSAQIIDCETGGIIVEMESDCNDFFNDNDEPSYYDDGDICGYE